MRCESVIQSISQSKHKQAFQGRRRRRRRCMPEEANAKNIHCVRQMAHLARNKF